MKEPIIIETLEVWPEDLGEMDWTEAMERVKELGPGWRLPTVEEFKKVLWPNRWELAADLGLDRLNIKVWSSSPSDWNETDRVSLSFVNGSSYSVRPNRFYYFLAVREADVIELLFRDF
jgi:hypothetical protein